MEPLRPLCSSLSGEATAGEEGRAGDPPSATSDRLLGLGFRDLGSSLSLGFRVESGHAWLLTLPKMGHAYHKTMTAQGSGFSV